MPFDLIHLLLAIASIALWTFILRITFRNDSRPADACATRRRGGISYHLPHSRSVGRRQHASRRHSRAESQEDVAVSER